MNGQALYRRWRPGRFGEVVGQEHVTRTLRNAVKLDRVAHGYLFSGPRGVAKTSTARILAKAINCLNPQDGEPCNACELCRSIAAGTSYDVLEMDAASNGLVDNVRDLRQNVMTHPDQARRKVYILDEAHRMSAPAFDALLKTLEEPPEHVVFILVTSEPDKIPKTIASRCQRFDFRRLPQRGIVERLAEICHAEGRQAEPAALDLIARAATGSMRDAQSLLDQLFAMDVEQIALSDVEAVLGTAGTAATAELAVHIVRRDAPAGLRLIGRAVTDGADPRQFCRDVADYLRGLLLIRLGGADEALDVTPETLAEMSALAAEAPIDQLLRAAKLFSQADATWRGSLHFQLPLELAFVEAILEPAAGGAVEASRPRLDRPGAAARPIPSRPVPPTPPPPRQPRPTVPGRPTVSTEMPPLVSTIDGMDQPSASTPAAIPPSIAPSPAGSSPSGRLAAVETTPAAAGSGADRVGSQPAAARPDASLVAPRSFSGESGAVEAENRPATPDPARPEGAAPAIGPAGARVEGAAALDVELLREQWPRFRRSIRQSSKRLEAFLNDVRPARVDGDQVVLEARFAAHQQAVMEPRHRALLEEEIQRSTGQAVRVTCVVAEGWPAALDEPVDPRDAPAIRAAIERGWQARLVESADGDEAVQ